MKKFYTTLLVACLAFFVSGHAAQAQASDWELPLAEVREKIVLVEREKVLEAGKNRDLIWRRKAWQNALAEWEEVLKKWEGVLRKKSKEALVKWEEELEAWKKELDEWKKEEKVVHRKKGGNEDEVPAPGTGKAAPGDAPAPPASTPQGTPAVKPGESVSPTLQEEKPREPRIPATIPLPDFGRVRDKVGDILPSKPEAAKAQPPQTTVVKTPELLRIPGDSIQLVCPEWNSNAPITLSRGRNNRYLVSSGMVVRCAARTDQGYEGGGYLIQASPKGEITFVLFGTPRGQCNVTRRDRRDASFLQLIDQKCESEKRS